MELLFCSLSWHFLFIEFIYFYLFEIAPLIIYFNKYQAIYKSHSLFLFVLTLHLVLIDTACLIDTILITVTSPFSSLPSSFFCLYLLVNLRISELCHHHHLGGYLCRFWSCTLNTGYNLPLVSALVKTGKTILADKTENTLSLDHLALFPSLK